MKRRILIGLAATAASLCPRSEAQTNGRTAGPGGGRGEVVNPCVQPRTRYKAIAAGGNHSLALKSDGTVVGWGYNDYGQSTVPANLTGVIAIAAGDAHSLA